MTTSLNAALIRVLRGATTISVCMRHIMFLVRTDTCKEVIQPEIIYLLIYKPVSLSFFCIMQKKIF